MIKISDIICNDNRQTDGIEELAANIKEIGLINPITLVRKGKKYEVAAGRRRFAALKQLGIEELADAQYVIAEADAEMIAFCENFHRQNLSIREEVEQLREIVQTRGESSVPAIAATLGKNEAWVRIRLRLLNLIPQFAKILDEGEAPISYLEEVGKYDAAAQERISVWMVTTANSLKKVKENIRDSAMIKLPASCPEECNTCPKNTATNTLFFTGEPAVCTDPKCAAGKIVQKVNALVQKAKEEKQEIYIVLDGFSDDDKAFKSIAKYLNPKWDFNFKKTGKKKVLIVGMGDPKTQNADVSYSGVKPAYCPPAQTKSKDKAQTAASSPTETADLKAQLKAKLEKLAGKRHAQALMKFVTFMEYPDTWEEVKNRFGETAKEKIKGLVLKYGYSTNFSRWEMKGKPATSGDIEHFYDIVLEGVVVKIASEVHEISKLTQKEIRDSYNKIEEFADDLAIDYQAEYLAPAEKSIPEPKSIADLRTAIKGAKRGN
ncbi:MAG: ParB/RepB/Spo0J family partition protein [Victivallaceae bacterium]|nr:ParB/RepB/Spo0J family partition protein [Victivallaceae bacterium]